MGILLGFLSSVGGLSFMSYVKINMKSTSDWKNVNKAKDFVAILVSEDNFFLPEKFDRQEPERFIFDPSNLSKFTEFWTSDIRIFMLKQNKPYLSWMMIDICYKESRQFNEISLYLDERYLQKEDSVGNLLSWSKKIYNWGDLSHGYICCEKDWENKNRFGKIVEDFKSRPVAGGGTHLAEGLPGMYWANFFGPVYVEHFGRKKFVNVPAYHKEELSDGGFLILTSQSPFEYEQRKTHKLEGKSINHLGRKAFFEKKYPKKLCDVPDFIFQQKALGRPIEVEGFDPVSMVISDAEGFINDVPQLVDVLFDQMKENLDYSPNNLVSIDKFILKKSYKKDKPWEKEKDRILIRAMTAYYGEVLRRNLKGEWCVEKGSGDGIHPVVKFKIKNQDNIEYPFTRVVRFWLEREGMVGLTNRYSMILTGVI